MTSSFCGTYEALRKFLLSKDLERSNRASHVIGMRAGKRGAERILDRGNSPCKSPEVGTRDESWGDQCRWRCRQVMKSEAIDPGPVGSCCS